MSTFVTVGSATQAFDRLLQAVSLISAELPRPIVVQRGPSIVSHRDWESQPFISMDEFERQIQQSSLLIMHAGAGSVIHAIRAGRLPIVMPRRAVDGEHIDDHQHEFATALASTGHVLLARDTAELRSAVHAALAAPGRRAAAPTQLVQHIRDVLAGLDAELMSKKAG